MKSIRWYLGGLLVLSLLVLAGCKKEPEPGPKPGPDGPPPTPMMALLEEKEPHAAGKKVFNSNGCMRCHTVGQGPGMPPMPPLPFPKDGPPMKGPPMLNKGPDLAKAGGKPGRNAEWFIKYVSDPKMSNPESLMPPFGKQINAEDMRALADFLESLK